MAYLTDPTAPIWEESIRFAAELAEAGEDLEPDVIHLSEGIRPPFGMITTQTCDIVEEDAAVPVWPWVQLVPVYDMRDELNSGQKKQLSEGRGFRRLLHVPALPIGFYAADFRLSFPVEKGWLARCEPIDGFGTEELRQRVGDRVALLGGRPAFAGTFVATVQAPLTTALRQMKQENRELYDKLDRDVPELGVRLDSRLNPSTAQVVVICNASLDEEEKEWWNRWWDDRRAPASEAGITLQALDFKVLDEGYSAAEYRQLTHLPLANVSPN
ncbi:MAG: hypothetical protein ACYC1D_16710 [Acidimicrobiales bacterium]